MIAMQMQEATCHLHNGKEINWAEMPLTGVYFRPPMLRWLLVGAFKVNPLQDICTVLEIEDLSDRIPGSRSRSAPAKPIFRSRFGDEFAKNYDGALDCKAGRGGSAMRAGAKPR